MSTVRQLIVDGTIVCELSTIDISQTYERVRGSYRARMRDGGLKQRTIWSGKLRTTITGNGLIPPGISLIDFDSSFTLSCIGHLAVNTTNTSVVLPSARRSDAGSEPYGRALNCGGKWNPTDVTMVGDTANITPVAGAEQYQVIWFPEIVVFADPPVEAHPEHGPTYSWSIVAEEI